MQTQTEFQKTPAALLDEKLDEQLLNSFRDTILFKNAAGVYTRPKRSLMAESETSTCGWDTVYAIKAKYLNDAIRNTRKYPGEGGYHGEFTVKGVVQNYDIDFKFDAWSITGGSGELLHMTIPITQGNLVEPSGTYNLAGASLNVEMSLSYYPKQSGKMKKGDYTLKVDQEAASEEEEDVIAVISVKCPGKIPGPVRANISWLMGEWLNLPDTLSKIELIFASVVIGEIGDEYKWLKPTAAGYAYGAGSSVDTSVFEVLAMTEDNPAPATHGFCYCDFNSSDEGVFMINANTFMKYTVKPGLETQYPKVTFTLDGKKLYGANLPLDDVKVNGIKYHPKVTSFSMTFKGKEIEVYAKAEVEVSPGIKGILETTTYYKLQLNTNQQTGEQSLCYVVEEGTSSVTKRTEIATWVVVTEVLVSVIAAVLGAVVAKIAEKVAYRVIIIIVAAIVAAVVGSIAVIIEKVIAAGSLDELPSILPMVEACTKPVQWPRDNVKNLDYFKITSFSLNGDILMKGIPMTK